MDNYPYELLSNIFEIVLTDVLDAAFQLSLVSRRFYSIAGPLRYRRLRISGLKRLEEALALVEKALQHTGARDIGIYHLFLCNYAKEHALMMDTRMSNATREDKMELAIDYYSQHPAFWDKASHLLRLGSLSLRTLYVLDYSEYPDPNLYYAKKLTPYEDSRLLFALSSCRTYPKLRSLVVKHDLRRGVEIFKENSSWVRPEMPALSYLQVKARCFVGRAGEVKTLYPLLDGIHTRLPNLTRLAFLVNNEHSFPELMCILCGVSCPLDAQKIMGLGGPSGERVKECIRKRILPGNLERVEAHLGRSPTFVGWSGFSVGFFHDAVLEFVRRIDMKQVAGLEMIPFSPAYPNVGEREYELLVKSFEDGIRM